MDIFQEQWNPSTIYQQNQHAVLEDSVKIRKPLMWLFILRINVTSEVSICKIAVTKYLLLLRALILILHLR